MSRLQTPPQARDDRKNGSASASSERWGADEADYCWARAKAEARCAGHAVHPAARDAHLGLAALYHQRALAALEVDAQAARDWMGEVGRLLARA